MENENLNNDDGKKEIDILNASDEDIMNMSDEDIMSMNPEEDIQDANAAVAKHNEDEEEKTRLANEEAARLAKEKEDAEKAAQKEKEDADNLLNKDDDEVDDPEKAAAAAKEAEDKAAAEKAEKDKEKENKEKTADENKTEEGKVDKTAEYDKILQPFKANGMMMQVKNADEAITLMQMGANYHKKMAGLKPVLKNIRLLEDNDLLEPEKLNYLIDLANKKPEAIAKLVKDSGIDPVTLDVTSDTDYTPENRTVSDTDIELTEVLDDIKSSPKYADTLNVISDEWDDASRDVIAVSPHIIKVINAHMEDGTYKVVSEAVNRQRILGKLRGISDLDAYKQVGDALEAAGLLPGQTKEDAPNVNADNTNDDAEKAAAAAKEKAEAERKARKKAASPSTPSVPAAKTAAIDPLALSDEEILKMDEKDFVIQPAS